MKDIGFESDYLTDWENYYKTKKNLTTQIIPPGYNSGYMLRVDWPRVTYGYHALILDHRTTDLCPGYNYTFRLGYRFANSTRPLTSNNISPVSIQIVSNVCKTPYPHWSDAKTLFPQTSWTHALWHYRVWTASALPFPRVYIQIQSRDDAVDIPGFTVYFDNLQITLDPPMTIAGCIRSPKRTSTFLFWLHCFALYRSRPDEDTVQKRRYLPPKTMDVLLQP